MAVRSPQDIYARHVSSERGYPIWTPEPSVQLLSCRPEGLKIGDVGVVVPENGNFDVFFNICSPKDHNCHRSGGVPDGFSHIELGDEDIDTVPQAESAGRVLAASSVARVGTDVLPIGDEAPERTKRYSFNMSSREGAVLVLPDGAESRDVRDPHPFLEQASLHATTWYHFAENNLGRIISHDSIYVITGFHKARSWGIAGYENGNENGDFPAHFNAGARDGGIGYGWESALNMEWRVSAPSTGTDVLNQAMFIRGFKIALKGSGHGVPQKWVSFQPALRPSHAASSSGGDSWLGSVWRGISKTIRPSSEEADRRSKPASRDNVGVRIEIQRIPEIAPVFHPSDTINQYILQKQPSAKVAITHDSDWGSILNKNLLKPEELANDELLVKAISENFDVILRDGVAHLESKSGSDTRIPVTADEFAVTEATEAKRVNETLPPGHHGPLKVVSKSDYRCSEDIVDECVLKSTVPVCSPPKLQSIPSAPATDPLVSPAPLRTIRIIVISDYICGFCYICDMILREAIEACQDLSVRFDVEFRPFVLINPATLPTTTDPDQVVYRNAYLIQRFGKEQAEFKLRASMDFSKKVGLKLVEDSILCGTTQSHRLSLKAYKEGGQELQRKFNTFIFDACLVKGARISDEDVLIDAAVSTGLMNKEEAVEFLRSTEYLDCVEKLTVAAKAQGINGVPFVIIDGKWAVNGLQPVECFIQIFRKLAQLPAPLTTSGKPKTTEHEHEVECTNVNEV